jgi:hypothetical protein
VCLAYDSEVFEPNDTTACGITTLLPCAGNFATQLIDAGEQLGIESATEVVSWIENVANAVPLVQEFALLLNQSADAINLAARPDLQSQVEHYQGDLSAGRKVVVVAHSQGNLYVNEAYALISPSPTMFNVVAVASPANYVAGGGPWTTLNNDFITWIAPGALPEDEHNTNTPGVCNPLPDLLSEINCHSFTDSYLAGNDSGPRILSEVIGDIPQVLFSNLGPNNTFASNGPAIGTQPSDQVIAASFVPQATSVFGGITVPVARFQGTAPLTIYLAEGSSQPGPPIETFTVNSNLLPATNIPALITLQSILEPTLQAKTKYWLVMQTDEVTGYTWAYNSVGSLGFSFTNIGTGWISNPTLITPAFAVNAAP